MRGRSIYADQFDFVKYYKTLKLLDFRTSEAAILAIELMQETDGPQTNARLNQVRDRYLEKIAVLQRTSGSKPTCTRDLHAGADHDPSRRSRLFKGKSPQKRGGKGQSSGTDRQLRSRRSRAFKTKLPQKLRKSKLDTTGGKAQSSSAKTKSRSSAKGMMSTVEKAMDRCAKNLQDALPVGEKAKSSRDKHRGKRRAVCAAVDDGKQSHWKKNSAESRPHGNKRARGMQCENIEEPHDGENDIKSDNIDVAKEWISVPLNEAAGEGCSPSIDNIDMFKPIRCSVKLRPEEIAFAFGSVSKVMQKGMNFLGNFESDINDEAYEEVRKFFMNAKGMVHEMERVIHTIQERQMEKLHAEKVKIEETRAAESRSLLEEIDRLSTENLAIKTTNLHAEKERDNIQKALLSELEKAREDLRVEKQKEHGKATDALKKELEMEHDKDCCQICFAANRDALILPCMHFHYCNDCLQKHQRRNGECPTCRTKISGVLRCQY